MASAHPRAEAASLPHPPAGTFNLTVNGVPQFAGAEAVFRESGADVSLTRGNLKLTSFTTDAGADGYGECVGGRGVSFGSGSERFLVFVRPPRFTSTTLAYTSSFGSEYLTQFRVYESAVVFAQTYVTGANGTAGPHEVLSQFPAFVAAEGPVPLGYVILHGQMVGEFPAYGVWGKTPITNGDDTGPIALFTPDLSLSFVISPASNFMAASEVRVLPPGAPARALFA